ncbi:STAS domain-containing protein [Ectothiorhodospiraceae bacterium BW-2]|nr:STAS domain-containing protein [Ectothiorhodospiraceae bacterium BW-2]
MRVPILRIRHLLLTSIQVDLNDQDLSRFREDMLTMVQNYDANGAVIDISALDVVDSYMARILSETAHMISLLGCRVVICGMQPAVALTLVDMGRELEGVETALNLNHGLEKLVGKERLDSFLALKPKPAATTDPTRPAGLPRR